MNEQSSPPKLKRLIQIERPIVGIPARKVEKTKQTLNVKKITKTIAVFARWFPV